MKMTGGQPNNLGIGNPNFNFNQLMAQNFIQIISQKNYNAN